MQLYAVYRNPDSFAKAKLRHTTSKMLFIINLYVVCNFTLYSTVYYIIVL